MHSESDSMSGQDSSVRVLMFPSSSSEILGFSIERSRFLLKNFEEIFKGEESVLPRALMKDGVGRDDCFGIFFFTLVVILEFERSGLSI